MKNRDSTTIVHVETSTKILSKEIDKITFYDGLLFNDAELKPFADQLQIFIEGLCDTANLDISLYQADTKRKDPDIVKGRRIFILGTIDDEVLQCIQSSVSQLVLKAGKYAPDDLLPVPPNNTNLFDTTAVIDATDEFLRKIRKIKTTFQITTANNRLDLTGDLCKPKPLKSNDNGTFRAAGELKASSRKNRVSKYIMLDVGTKRHIQCYINDDLECEDTHSVIRESKIFNSEYYEVTFKRYSYGKGVKNYIVSLKPVPAGTYYSEVLIEDANELENDKPKETESV